MEAPAAVMAALDAAIQKPKSTAIQHDAGWPGQATVFG
jgi:hypothetical protein